MAAPTVRTSSTLQTTGAGTRSLDISGAATDDLMVVFVAANQGSPGPPAGWTQIKAAATWGTLFGGSWARKKLAGDGSPSTGWTMSVSGGSTHVMVAVRDWDGDIADLVIGATGTRAGSGGTFTTTAPALTTVSADNLVLGFFGERSTATEVGPSSIGNSFTQYLFVPHGGAQIETALVVTRTFAVAVSSGAVSVVYPNSQASNGSGWLIAVPPASTHYDLTIPADGYHGHTGDTPSLTVAAALVVADGFHAHTGDAFAVTVAATLTVNDGYHGHTGDTFAVTAGITLTVNDGYHGHTGETFTVGVGAVLVVADGYHGHTGETFTIPSDDALVVADGYHGHTGALVDLLLAATLVIADGYHRHTGETIPDPSAPTPPSLTVATTSTIGFVARHDSTAATSSATASVLELVARHASTSTLSPSATSTIHTATATSILELVPLPAFPLVHFDEWVVTDDEPHQHIVEKF